MQRILFLMTVALRRLNEVDILHKNLNIVFYIVSTRKNYYLSIQKIYAYDSATDIPVTLNIY